MKTLLEIFNKEINKLDLLSDNLKLTIEVEIEILDKKIKANKKEIRKITTLDGKVLYQKEIANLEKERNKLRIKLYNQQDKIEKQKEEIINKVSAKIK